MTMRSYIGLEYGSDVECPNSHQSRQVHTLSIQPSHEMDRGSRHILSQRDSSISTLAGQKGQRREG